MEGIKIEVIGNIARVIKKPTRITAGTVGLPIEFTFDSQWDGLKKMVVFRAGCCSIQVELTGENTEVPWEVLATPKYWLSVGLHGVNAGGTIAIPTIWVNVCVIHPGAKPGGALPTDPTPPVWQRIEDDVHDINEKIDEIIVSIDDIGAGTLIVTVDGKNASHNSEQIYEHIKGGGTAVLLANSIYYPLIQAKRGQAEFGLYDHDEGHSLCYIVWTDGAVDFSSKDIVDMNRLDENVVFYSKQQTLTIDQKAQARANIDAIGMSEGEETLFIECEQGGIASATGKETTGTNRLRSGYLETAGLVKVATNSNNYQIYGHFYEADGTHISDGGTGWKSYFLMEDILKTHPDAYYFRIVVRDKNDNAITPDDVIGIIEMTYKKTVIDAELVLYKPQSLTPEQQAIVRANIGAMASEENHVKYIYGDENNRTQLQLLASGLYVLHGYFSADDGKTVYQLSLSDPTLACVVKGDNTSNILLIGASGKFRHISVAVNSQKVKNYDFSNFESLTNRVAIIDSESDDEHYPTAKSVYDAINSAIDDFENGMGIDPSAPTDEKYFDITRDGVVSLKPEYRGAIPESSPDSTLDASKSDAGFGAVGSKNAELPKNIIIPAIVNEVAVTGLAVGMIMYNDAVESITIPSYITEIPDYFAHAAKGLQAIKGTENVRVLGRNAFFKTPLKTVSFPKLEVAVESGNPLKGSQFKCCSNLISADLGNLTSIPKQMFEFCQRLSCVHGAENVKTVGESAFARTSRLRNVNFLPKLTNINNYAFTSSRIDYDWESLKEAGCTFGTKYATRLQYNPKDADGLGWWEKATPTPCKNPLRSILDQADPRWADEKFKGTNTTFKDMCGLFCAMMIHSALAEKDINHPDDFIKDIENIENPKHDYFAPVGGKPCVGLSESGLEDLLVDLGHEVTRLKINVSDADPEDTIKHDNLQAVYDALAQGALVWAVVDGASSDVSTDHVNVWYGVNEYGEMLSQDPNDGRVMYFGGENDMHFAIPIQNVHEIGKALMIVKKKA